MFIFRCLIVISYLKSSNDNLIREQIFERFTTAYNDENTLQNWMKLTKRESICELILFKEILRKIGDVVSMINTKKYTNIKSLFMKTNMKLENIGYPYLETYNIIASSKRIISIYDGLNTSKNQNAHTFSEEALYYEYDQIYKIHELTIVEIWHKIHFGKIPTNLYDESTVKNNDLPNSRHSCTSIIKFYDLFNYALIALLPTTYQNQIYVVTNSKGLQSSRWCTENFFHCFIREKSTTVCPPLIIQNLRKCKLENSIHELIDLKEFMKQSYFCDRTTAKVLIMLFHYYSDVKSKSTRIEIIRTEDNEYHIKWSFSKSPSLKQIKEYWMKQDIDNFASRPIFYKLNSGNINKSNYSTNRSIQTHKNPIKTRLILLSCGHQLGFGFIDKFFRKYYMKYSNVLDCPTCKKIQSLSSVVMMLWFTNIKKKLHLVQFVKNERIIFQKYEFLQIKYLISI